MSVGERHSSTVAYYSTHYSPPCVSNDGETEAEMALAYPPRPAASDLCITASILITTNNQPSIGSAVPQLFLQARPEERCVGR